MHKLIPLWMVILSVICLDQTYAASAPSAAGLWKTYDLDGTTRCIVNFMISGNRASVVVVKPLLPKKGGINSPICTKCPPPYTNRPYIGLPIIWGLTRQADGSWAGGQVLDTDSGKIYNCIVTVSPDGRILHLHAYVGMRALGKTVDWTRVDGK